VDAPELELDLPWTPEGFARQVRADIIPAQPMHVLAVGPIPPWLLRGPLRVDWVPGPAEALEYLAERKHVVVVIAPHIDGDGDGVRFAAALHGRRTQEFGDAGWPASARDLPILLLPVGDDDEYAVRVPPWSWCLRTGGTPHITADIIRLVNGRITAP
jgi:hypothetical protein